MWLCKRVCDGETCFICRWWIKCSACRLFQLAHAKIISLQVDKKRNNLLLSRMLQTVCHDGNKGSSGTKRLEYGAANSSLSGLIITPGTQTKNKHVAI